MEMHAANMTRPVGTYLVLDRLSLKDLKWSLIEALISAFWQITSERCPSCSACSYFP